MGAFLRTVFDVIVNTIRRNLSGMGDDVDRNCREAVLPKCLNNLRRR